MKTIVLAALAAVATLAPLHAVEKAFKVTNVLIVTPNSQRPPGAPNFKKGDTVRLDIGKNRVTGPQGITIPIASTSVTADVYNKVKNVASTDTATIRKNGLTGKKSKIIGGELNFTRPVKMSVFGQTITTAGMITYTLEPK